MPDSTSGPGLRRRTETCGRSSRGESGDRRERIKAALSKLEVGRLRGVGISARFGPEIRHRQLLAAKSRRHACSVADHSRSSEIE